MKIVFTADGKVLVSVPTGTYEQAKSKIEKLLRELGVDGAKIVPETEIESHRHDDLEHLRRFAHDHH